VTRALVRGYWGRWRPLADLSVVVLSILRPGPSKPGLPSIDSGGKDLVEESATPRDGVPVALMFFSPISSRFERQHPATPERAT